MQVNIKLCLFNDWCWKHVLLIRRGNWGDIVLKVTRYDARPFHQQAILTTTIVSTSIIDVIVNLTRHSLNASFIQVNKDTD